MSFQTCKTFIHLQNTNSDIFWARVPRRMRLLCPQCNHLYFFFFFYWCPYYVSGPGNISVALLSMGGSESWFNQTYLNLCSEDERRSYRFETTWGWVINGRIFIFGWTNPLKQIAAKTYSALWRGRMKWREFRASLWLFERWAGPGYVSQPLR